MSHAKRRVGLLAALVIGLLATLIPAVPTADAAVTPWTWKRVTQSFTVSTLTSMGVRATCPANYTAITGGLLVPVLKEVRPHGQYREDDVSGSGWKVNFRNYSGSSVSGSVVVECVETADLPPISYNTATFAQDGNGYAEGTVPCLNAGEVALSGGADWNAGALNRELLASAPPSSTSAWYGYGYNPTSDDLTVDIYCVDAANVPGLTRATTVRSTEGWYTETATCPVGKRILNGGALPTSFASYPNLTSWTSTIQRFSGESTHTIRATCIDAGLPTVNLTYTSPGPSGSLSNTGGAGFSMSGSDPAGYPSNFLCAIDDGSYTNCNGGANYAGLSSGPHTFEVLNVTADGRTSDVASYQWTVDTVAPTVTKPKLARVILAASTEAKWGGSDVHTDVDHYQAAYRLFRVDGTATAWTMPLEWSDIGGSVQTPAIAQGQTVCVSARSFDQVNNVSPWSAPACTTRPLDDRALTASGGWTRATGSAYWLNTVSRTTTSGQTLKLNDVHLNRVGILASVCNGCGAVVVKVGTTKIGRINLDARSTAHRKVKLLPAFTGTTGVVTIKSVTSGRTISIDGLIAIQSGTLPPT